MPTRTAPLTEAVKRLGYKAVRFTKGDGDLATFSGRQKLWGLIEKVQQSICGWHLNADHGVAGIVSTWVRAHSCLI